MADVEVKLVKSQNSHRPHSDFLCREMFYEHLEGRLEPSRRRSVDLLIESSEEMKREYRCLRRGLGYLESLRELKIEVAVLADLSGESSRLARWGAKIHWRKWPSPLRWSMQALTVAVATAYGVAYLPWHKLPVATQVFNPQSVELARIERSADPPPEILVTSFVPQEEAATVADVRQTEAVESELESDEAQAAAQKQVEEAEETKAEEVAAQLEEQEETREEEKKPVLKGFVYRSYPLMSRLDERAPIIAGKIIELGGAKAGQVELGWRRKDSRYFHFSLPEENYDELIAFLQQFAIIKVVKDNHRRVMPEGQIRFILWIEEVPEKSSPQ